MARNRTAHTLNSGSSEIGSTASLVSALMVRSAPCSSFQWKGAKQLPGRTRSVTAADISAMPRRDVSSTRLPSVTSKAVAPSGCISTNGPLLSLLSVATLPVLVMVCHWCCTRPVFGTTGNSSSGSSWASMCGRGWKTARPDGVGNANRGVWPDPSTKRSWLTPSLR